MKKPDEAWTAARLRAALIGVQALSPPWALRVPASTAATLYHVGRGAFWIRASGGQSIEIAPGGLALMPAATSHDVASSSEMNGLVDIADVEDLHRVTGDASSPSATQILAIVGHWQAETRPAILGLPTLMRLTADEIEEPIVALLGICGGLASEGINASAFGTLVANALLLAIIGAATPHSMAAAPRASAIGDPAIIRALMLIQASESAIPVDVLARAVGLGRSTFIERFREATGQPPAQYQSTLRLARAADRLLATNESAAQIARAHGFSSEAAFSRAFSRQFGQAPARWRNLRRPI